MNLLEFYPALVREIISEQEMIIGPLAWEQAGKVSNLVVDKKTCVIEGRDPKKVVEDLVIRYAKLFGQASVDTCRVAAGRIVRDYGEKNDALPQNLQT